jgi:hypothetical protein
MTADTTKTESPTGAKPALAAAPGSPIVIGGAAMQAWMEMGSEVVRFVWDRLQQDLQTQQDMLACTNLDDMRSVQARFFRAAQDQYAAEARILLTMIAKASPAGLVAAAAARKYDDVPL